MKKSKPAEQASAPAATTTAQPFKAIRRAGVPICAIQSADPAQSIRNCIAAMNGKLDKTAVAQWNIIDGLTGINDAGKAFSATICGQDDPAIATGNPAECLKKLATMTPEKAVVFFHNAHRFIDNESVSQGIWNLRDIYKSNGATLVLLCPALTLPAELKQDAVIISEPLPDEMEISKIVDSTAKDAELDPATITDRPLVIDTLRGLSAFAAEQVLAMSITKAGIDNAGLWERKRKMIEQTPGLSVWTGGETFDDLGGLDNLKTFLTRVLTSGKTPVRAILYIDEADKSLGGTSGDTSNTSQDQLGTLLKVMQDTNLPGMILVGPPGTGKSSIAKAAGTVANAPVIACDLGAMKASLVGESEKRIRAAMEVFQAVSQGKGLAIATCNKLVALPPELKRRFSLGTFYLDLASASEQLKIWPLWMSRYSLDMKQELPTSDGWTGSEIRACCDVAFRCDMTLKEASQYVVPICKSSPDALDQLRKLANGRFISANYPGVYDMNRRDEKSTGRRIEND